MNDPLTCDDSRTHRGAPCPAPDCWVREGRFERTPEGLLVVTNQNLEEALRTLALQAMNRGATVEQKQAALRCLVGHCEAMLTDLAHNRTPSPLGGKA